MKRIENENNPVSGSKIWSSTWFALGIIVVQILVSVIIYPFMPAQVPSHWNAAGQINGYMPRLSNAIFVPAMSLGIYVLLLRSR